MRRRHGWTKAAIAALLIAPAFARGAPMLGQQVESGAAAQAPSARITLPIAMVLADRASFPAPATAEATETTTPTSVATGSPPPTPLDPTSTAPPSFTPPSSTPPVSTPTTPPAPDCAAVPAFDDGLTPSRELWVSPAGDDVAGDGSRGAPYRTIERAAREATPGTAIRLVAGEHSGGHYLDGLRGSADAPIWIGGETPLDPFGEAGGGAALVGSSEGLHLSRSSYVVVHDLAVRGSAYNGINADDGGDVSDPATSHHLVFRRVKVEDVGGDGNQDCLKLSGLSGIVVDRSAFRRCGGGGSGSGIDMVGVHRAVVARSVFESMSGNAVQTKGGTADVVLRRNTIRDGGARAFNLGGSTGYAFFRPPLDPDAPNAEARRIRAYSNIIEGGDTPFAFVGCVDCLVANNTVIDPGIWLMRILQESLSGDVYEFEPARDGRVINTLFVFRRERLRTYLNIGPNTAPGTFAFSHNLWFAADDPSRSAPELPVPEIGGITGLDPLIGADGSIGPESPAAGAGIALDADAFDPLATLSDHAGACFAEPPSIGAREG